MESLAKEIAKHLSDKKFCTIFGDEVRGCWPLPPEVVRKRDAAIRAFAKKHGWSATIRDPGVRVIFRKLES